VALTKEEISHAGRDVDRRAYSGIGDGDAIAPDFAQTARTGRGATAVAVGEGGKVQESNEWTVGIAGGLLEGTNKWPRSWTIDLTSACCR
jgi:hypothetical protein